MSPEDMVNSRKNNKALSLKYGKSNVTEQQYKLHTPVNTSFTIITDLHRLISGTTLFITRNVSVMDKRQEIS